MKGYLNEDISSRTNRTTAVVFLDRDGVINQRMPPHCHVVRWEDFKLLPGVYDALRVCNKKGIPAILITNQRCISLGIMSEEKLNHIHDKMLKDFEDHGVYMDGIFYCPHGNEDGCNCRKPKTGLFEEAERELKIRGITLDKAGSWMIGDEEHDTEAGARFGLNTVQIKTKKERKGINFYDDGRVHLVSDNILNAVEQSIGR